MTDGHARFTRLEKILSLLLIAGLAGFGFYLVRLRHSERQTASVEENPEIFEAEATDTSGLEVVTDHTYAPSERLPHVEGDSRYQWDPKEKILRFSYNIWPGWLPVIAANRGTMPTRDSIFYKKYGFRVQMVLMDNPAAARDAFVAGKIHTLWGTVDMMVLLASDLMKDSRSAPRIVQQIDWSGGGNGIVVKRPIKRLDDLRSKTVALAQYSPGEFQLNLLLLYAGLRPDDVGVKYTATAFEASASLVSDENIDACISWAPDIYRIPERVAETQILSGPGYANKLIADVYAVRADFARDHPEIVEGLVAGIFEGMDYSKQRPEHGVRWMADAFHMMPEELMDMSRDVHTTNFAENVQFFLNASNPTNFEQTWKNANRVFEEFGRISNPVPFDQVADSSFLQGLRNKGTFAHHRDESTAAFIPAGVRRNTVESSVLTQPVRISFYPNSSNPYEAARDEHGKALEGKLYDSNISATLQQIAWLSEQFDRAVILIEGHADSSMKGQVPAHSVRELSLLRAEAIQRALIEKFRFDPSRIRIEIEGSGWEVPSDSDHPDNHRLNRRVEISVFSDIAPG